MLRLACGSQQYAWGKKGKASVVAQLLEGGGGEADGIRDDQAYAEFWMGTHPNCPSHVVHDSSGSTKLASWLHDHPSALGGAVQQRWPSPSSTAPASSGERQLPFLFKVLSIEQALSIQAHPDRALGRVLRATKPQHYPDDNHKPEMALAVTPCEVLCGFRTVQEIAHLISHAPEFAQVVGKANVDRFLAEAGKKSDKEVVKPLFESLMRADSTHVAQCVKALYERVTQSGGRSSDVSVGKTDALAARLHKQFPGDVGCFVTYFLNHLHLEPGQAIFLGPNVPHAYICGDMVEAMASSDNTVRAGLTPKFKDVDTLVEMLTYKCGEPDWVHPTVHEGVKIYTPPIEEFMVSAVHLPQGSSSSSSSSSVTVPPCDSFSLVLVYDGEGQVEAFNGQGQSAVPQTKVHKGQVYGLAAGHSLKVTGQGVVIFKANVNCERVPSAL